MRRFQLLITLFLLVGSIAEAQVNRYGVPFIRNISPIETHAGEQNWSVLQDQRGVIFMANNDNGVLEYDGMSWRQIPIPDNLPLRDLCVGDDGTLYAGGDKEFGRLVPDEHGNLVYESLTGLLDSADNQFKTIYHIYSLNGKIYFSAARFLYVYHPDEGTLDAYALDRDGFRMGNFGFSCHGRYIHLDAEQGLLDFDGEHFRNLPNGRFFAYHNLHSSVLAILPHSGNEVLVLTYKSGAYGYDLKTGKVDPSVFPSATNDYLKTYRFYHGIRLPDGAYALGTLDGGLVITDTPGHIREILNRQAGLDNETVTKVFANEKMPHTSQLWIALNIGAARAEYFSPFRYFSEDHGFKGTVNDLFLLGNDLYLATSTGVFRRIFSRSGIATFERIEGINAQTWQLLYFPLPGSDRHLLWAGTEEGIYEIRGDKAYPVEKHIHGLPLKDIKFYVFSLFSSKRDPGKVIIGTGKGLSILRYRNGQWYFDGELTEYKDEVRSIAEDDRGNIWFSFSYEGIARLEKTSNGYKAVLYGEEKGLPREAGLSVRNVLGRLMVATSSQRGLFSYDPNSDTFRPDDLFGGDYRDGRRSVQNIYQVNDTTFFLNTLMEDGSFRVEEAIRRGKRFHIIRTPFLRLPPQSAYTFEHENDHVWIAISNKIYSYDLRYPDRKEEPFRTLIRKITYGEDSLLFGGTFFTTDEEGNRHPSLTQDLSLEPQIKYALNNITFRWACPYFEGTEGTEYSFRLKGFDKNWSKWTHHNEFPYTNIPNGSYVFEVKARNIYGEESLPGRYAFTILPPWYLTFWAIMLYIILAFLLIVVIVKLYTRRLQKEKERLEAIVRERTAEVVRQKEELTDSIMYASRIQRAVLPSERLLNEQFPEHFILFLPRDIVSGDFYWMSHRDGKVFVTAADCTGHGVPGAFMSLLGISFLNEIINRIESPQPDQILNELRNEIKQSLKQRGEEGEAKDGMDMALVAIEKGTKKLFYAGAYNPLYFVRRLTDEEKALIARGEDPGFGRGSMYNEKYVLLTIPADKMPIGISAKDEIPFTLHELEYSDGDRIYLFSDGYIDQFGGPQGKKFMSKNFKKLILNIQDIPMKEQEELLHTRLKEWRGDLPQVDDIIVIGIML